MNIKTVLIAVAVSSCMLTSPLGQASEHSSVFTPEQEKRIGEIAADYMRAHPDILIQMSEKLQAEQQERESRELKSAALAQQARILSDKNIPSWGPLKGRSWSSSSSTISASGAADWHQNWKKS